MFWIILVVIMGCLIGECMMLHWHGNIMGTDPEEGPCAIYLNWPVYCYVCTLLAGNVNCLW